MPHRTATQANSGKNRHMCHNDLGQLCMTVVDPATRKLSIPVTHIYETRAQHRNTLPSLCQLFLSNRCRQGANCYQVHANWEMVEQLRSEVDALPCCCVRHGDPDRAGVLLNPVDFAEFMHIPPPGMAEISLASQPDDAATDADDGDDGLVLTPAAKCLGDVVLYLPNCEVGTLDGQGCIALEDVSFTMALKRLLEEQDPLSIMVPAAGAATSTSCRRITVLNARTGVSEEKFVVDGTGCTVCRLHALDRCRYAEQCKFLHLCKEITNANPALTQNNNSNNSGVTVTEANPNSAFAGGTDAQQSADGAIAGDAATTGNVQGRTSRNPRHPHHNNHGGNSVFTTISRQQQLLRASASAGNNHNSNNVMNTNNFYASSSFGASAGSSSFLPYGATASPYANLNECGSYGFNNGSWASYSAMGNAGAFAASAPGRYYEDSYNSNNQGCVPFASSFPMPPPRPVVPSSTTAATTTMTATGAAVAADATAPAPARRPALLVPQHEQTDSLPSMSKGPSRVSLPHNDSSEGAMDGHTTTTPHTNTGTASSTPNFHTRNDSEGEGSTSSGMLGLAPLTIDESASAKSCPTAFSSINMANSRSLPTTANGAVMSGSILSAGNASGYDSINANTAGGKAHSGRPRNGVQVVITRRQDGKSGGTLLKAALSMTPPLTTPSPPTTTTTTATAATAAPTTRSVRTWQHNPYSCTTITPSLEENAVLQSEASGSVVSVGLYRSRREALTGSFFDYPNGHHSHSLPTYPIMGESNMFSMSPSQSLEGGSVNRGYMNSL